MSKKFISGQIYMKFVVAIAPYKIMDTQLTYQHFREGVIDHAATESLSPLEYVIFTKLRKSFMRVASTSLPPPL